METVTYRPGDGWVERMKEVKSSGDTWTEISRAAGTARRVVKCSKNDRATQRVRQSVMETCGARRDTLRLEWSSGLPSPRTFPKIQKQKQSNKKTQLQAKTEIEDQGYPRLLPPSPTPRALAHPSDRPPVAVSPPSRGRLGAAETQAPRADSSEPSHSRGLPFPPGPQLPAQLGAVRLGSRYPPSVQLVPDPALPFPSRSLLHPCISLFLHPHSHALSLPHPCPSSSSGSRSVGLSVRVPSPSPFPVPLRALQRQSPSVSSPLRLELPKSKEGKKRERERRKKTNPAASEIDALTPQLEAGTGVEPRPPSSARRGGEGAALGRDFSDVLIPFFSPPPPSLQRSLRGVGDGDGKNK